MVHRVPSGYFEPLLHRPGMCRAQAWLRVRHRRQRPLPTRGVLRRGNPMWAGFTRYRRSDSREHQSWNMMTAVRETRDRMPLCGCWLSSFPHFLTIPHFHRFLSCTTLIDLSEKVVLINALSATRTFVVPVSERQIACAGSLNTVRRRGACATGVLRC